MDADLVASGRYARIETHGRRTGAVRTVTVGYVDDPAAVPPAPPAAPTAILVASGASDSAWAANLVDEPACRVTIGARSFDGVAEPLERADHGRAVAALILRYGTPAEGLGTGPSFRIWLRPDAGGPR
jgi:deazaflavin-dependent oxidoreductase (nitroreductase family)